MRFFFLFSILLVGLESFSQDSTKPYVNICGYPGIYPEYPGGGKALMKYLKDSIKLPKSVSDSGWSGKIIVRFKIDTLGLVINPVIIKDNIRDTMLRISVINLFKSMPKWKAGTELGKPKEFTYTLPVNFTQKK